MQQRILPLSKQDTPGLLQALARVPDPRDAAAGMRRLLTTAGYAPIADTADGPWGKTTGGQRQAGLGARAGVRAASPSMGAVAPEGTLVVQERAPQPCRVRSTAHLGGKGRGGVAAGGCRRKVS